MDIVHYWTFIDRLTEMYGSNLKGVLKIISSLVDNIKKCIDAITNLTSLAKDSL